MVPGMYAWSGASAEYWQLELAQGANLSSHVPRSEHNIVQLPVSLDRQGGQQTLLANIHPYLNRTVGDTFMAISLSTQPCLLSEPAVSGLPG